MSDDREEEEMRQWLDDLKCRGLMHGVVAERDDLAERISRAKAELAKFMQKGCECDGKA